MQSIQTDGDGFLPINTEKDKEMNNVREWMKPTAIAALILLAGGTSTAPATADDQRAFAASELSSAGVQETSKEQAKLANEAAVEEAADAIKADARLDLDIRLIGRTSDFIAREM